MSILCNRINLATIIFFCILAINQTGSAKSFPFRNINPGDIAPPIEFDDLDGAISNIPNSLQGQPVILIFWGADIPTKKERSLKALKEIQDLLPFLEEHAVKVVSVNVQGDSPASIKEITAEASLSFPTLLDRDQKVYGRLGIFVMPSILILDKEGKVKAGMGYSHDFIDRLKGEISIMLGIKTRDEVDAELRPVVVEKSKEEKAARRHLNMGRVMMDQRMVDRAIHEYQEALKLNPNLAEAHIELACSFLDANQFDAAEKSLDAGLEIDPDSFRGQICDAKLSAALGELDEAIGDLQDLMMRNAREPELHFTLGSLYEQKNNPQKAAESFRKAYELLKKQKKH